MRRTWDALHESLVRSADSLDAHRVFETERQRQVELRPFEHPAALVDFFTTKGGDLDRKDRIYAALVRTAQQSGDGAQLAVTILWLGLWPALDATYRRLLRRYFHKDPEALVSEIGARFTSVIHNANLNRINRVAATLRRNVQRDILDGLKRQWAEEARRAHFPSDEFEDNEDAHTSVGDLKLTRQSPHLRTRGMSKLGLPPYLDVDEDIRALRTLLAKLVNSDADADLIIGMAVHEENQRELGERLGISYEAARKRVQRVQPVIERLKKELEEIR